MPVIVLQTGHAEWADTVSSVRVWSTANGWIGPIIASTTAWWAATDLAEVLSCDIVAWSNRPLPSLTGIVIGTFAELAPALVNEPLDYVLWTTRGKVLLAGRDAIETERAVWHFARILGYKCLAPTVNWDIMPAMKPTTMRLTVGGRKVMCNVNGLGSACGLLADSQDRLTLWTARNMLANSSTYRYGHSWAGIAIYGNLPTNPGKKLCVLAPEVQAAAISLAKSKAIGHPEAEVISMSASDGTLGWTDICPGRESKMSPSDRQISLAMTVQEALDADPACHGARVAILAYGDTSRKPTMVISPRIVVVVADAYIKDGRTYDDVVADYRKAGAVDVVPYSYLSVWQWTHGEPTRSRTYSNTLLRREVDRALANTGSLVMYSTEGGGTWGPDGIGYWVLGRMLVEPDLDPATLRTEYVNAAFPGLSIMHTYYALISTPAPLTTDLVSRLYQAINIGIPLTDHDPKMAGRMHDLIVYVRYLDLLCEFSRGPSLVTYEAVMEHMFRARDRDLVAYRCAYFDAAWGDWHTKLEAKYGRSITPSSGPWKDAPFSVTELEQTASIGEYINQRLTFKPRAFPGELELVPRPNDTRARGSFLYTIRDHSWMLWMRPDQTQFVATARAGIVTTTAGPGVVKVIELGTETVLAEVVVPPDRASDTKKPAIQYISIPLEGGQMYRLDLICDGGLDLSCPGFAVTYATTIGLAPFIGQYSGYFMVPAGTVVIGGYSNAAGADIISPEGTVVYTTTMRQYWSVIVVARAWDTIWKVEGASGSFGLLTVPPGLAMHPDELLSPRPQ